MTDRASDTRGYSRLLTEASRVSVAAGEAAGKEDLGDCAASSEGVGNRRGVMAPSGLNDIRSCAGHRRSEVRVWIKG